MRKVIDTCGKTHDDTWGKTKDTDVGKDGLDGKVKAADGWRYEEDI